MRLRELEFVVRPSLPLTPLLLLAVREDTEARSLLVRELVVTALPVLVLSVVATLATSRPRVRLLSTGLPLVTLLRVKVSLPPE